MKTLALLLPVALLSSGAAAAARSDRVADVGALQFEQGGRVEAMRVGYSLYGHLDAARDNAILLLPPTSGTRRSYDALIGPGKPFHTERFMVITVDPIGSGLSSRPSDGLGEPFSR
jgi:homoserine O-acetyltransferase